LRLLEIKKFKKVEKTQRLINLEMILKLKNWQN
jgi:hypothetical protein